MHDYVIEEEEYIGSSIAQVPSIFSKLIFILLCLSYLR